jgi:dephospho-CoA kinase
MITVGLTGSIGMGKSTTANMFRRAGFSVHDSDAAVHAIYRGPNVTRIEALFPGVVVDGQVDRVRLAAQVLNNPERMRSLEALVHPLVGQDREDFLAVARARGDRLAVVDIPLLFEIQGTTAVDVVVVVSAPLEVQRARVLSRPGMTAGRFDAIIAKQAPDLEKRKGAHWVIDTSRGVENAEFQLRRLIEAIGSMVC